jgi:hypothetical protein
MKAISTIVGVMALVSILGLAGISSVAALEQGGEWEPLAAGESRWVSFQYVGHLEYEEVDEEEVAFWAGSFSTPGAYYIVVENGSPADASFQLGIGCGNVMP